MSYKHFLSISSQISFCSAPLRLDSFNKCQFSCDYCYARSRTGSGRDAKLLSADPSLLEKRLSRVFSGNIASALDEFLARRVPIQFGGMSDPFMPIENVRQVTSKILQILKHYQYPFMLSTKGPLLFHESSIRALEGTNSIIRISFSGASKNTRLLIDRGGVDFDYFLDNLDRLRSRGLKIGIRLQPLIPGEEDHALGMIERLEVGSVDHLSCEYLKVPVSGDKKFGADILRKFDGSIINWYKRADGKLVGNEYVLPSTYRRYWLDRIAAQVRSKNMTFGYADNDFLLLSDGNGCCSGCDLYLNHCNIFTANTLGILKMAQSNGTTAKFSDISEMWYPSNNIAQYLNSKTRLVSVGQPVKEWVDYAAASWNGEWGLYSPSYFDASFRK